MSSPLRLSLLLLAVAAAATLTHAQNSTVTCATGLHLIVARGSAEPAGLGRIGVVAGNVTEMLAGSTVAAVDYPATFSATGYFASVYMGTAAMTAMIAAYVLACPTSKIALLGYSQGGQVAMDVVCGTSETLFKATPDLSDAFANHGMFERSDPFQFFLRSDNYLTNRFLQVVAIVTFGDPSHMPGMPWNEGTSNRTGVCSLSYLTPAYRTSIY